MSTHLFVSPGNDVPSELPPQVTSSVLSPVPASAAREIDVVVRDVAIETLVFWDPVTSSVPWRAVERFRESGDDAWHPGAAFSANDEISDRLRYVMPLWVYRPIPPSGLAGAVNWRLDLRACLLRAAAVRNVGGVDGQFETLVGAAQELGLRLLQRGGICRQQPSLSKARALPARLTDTDAYRIVSRVLGQKWLLYAGARRVLDGHALGAELRAGRASMRERSPSSIGGLHRELEAVVLPRSPSVSVVLPTFGRYRYLAEVLDDLRQQTIRPTQILIADGNAVGDRASAPYDRYRDLPIEVIWHTEGGTCSSRNACLQRATGDYVWFVDDDSRFDLRNLEMHLRVLSAYRADVSVGPAFTKSRPDLHPEQREIACSFMDCGTTLCRAQILHAVGGFDMQFNDYLAGEDGELGVRFVRAGGLMVNNPHAKRFHYLAPIGGARRSRHNVHRWTRWSLLPRPVQSIYYTARRHFEPSVATDATFQAAVLAGWRRKEGVIATRLWKLRTLLGEIVALPLTAYRLKRSLDLARAMIDRGPRIPSLAALLDQRAVR